MRIIKVEELDLMGFGSGTKYFKSLNKAKRYFKQLIKNHKCDLADDMDCSYCGKAITYNDNRLINKKGFRNKSVNLECWYSSETDCGTEYDTEVITVYLREITIEE